MTYLKFSIKFVAQKTRKFTCKQTHHQTQRIKLFTSLKFTQTPKDQTFQTPM
jgi:hypothetical protein